MAKRSATHRKAGGVERAEILGIVIWEVSHTVGSATESAASAEPRTSLAC